MCQSWEVDREDGDRMTTMMPRERRDQDDEGDADEGARMLLIPNTAVG
jgi:hypothetical protein